MAESSGTIEERTRAVWDSLAVGEELGSYEYVLTQGMLDDYRRVVGNPHAAYPTIAGRHCDHAFRLRYDHDIGLMNAGHDCEYHNPPIPGKRITVTGRIADKFVKRDKPYTIVEARAVDEDGRLIEISRIYGVASVQEISKKWS